MVKNRAVFIIAAGVFFFYMLINYFLSSPASSGADEKSTVDSAPKISTAPGVVSDNERYSELQRQANEEGAQKAKKNMQSFVPTLVNRTGEDTELLDQLLEEKRKEKNAEETARQNALKEAQENAQRRLREQQERMDNLRKEQEQRRDAANAAKLAEQKAKDYQKELDRRKQVYLKKISEIDKNVRYTPMQAYQAGTGSSMAVNGANLQGGSNNVDNKTAPLYKAGTILYAVIETSLNTDEPAPILAKITSGPLKGSRLIGSTKGLGSEWAEGVILEFSTVSIPMMPSSQGIKCIAVDPVTARTVLADEVNHHYIQRYGALFFSKLLEGYANAIQTSGSTTTTDPNTGEETTTNAETTDAENFFIALGNVGTALSSQVGKVVDRPTTIKINQGSAVGLLLLEDFSIQS